MTNPLDFSKWNNEPEFKNPTKDTWSEKHGPAWLPELKTHIRNHFLENDADFPCCYCKRSPRSTHGLENHVEHMAPRSPYTRFTFEPKNLAIICIHCNGHKLHQDVFKKEWKQRSYPSNSKPFKVYHPSFDDYTSNIKIVPPFGIYAAVTPEGAETILMCRLDILNNAIFSRLTGDGVYSEIDFTAVELCEGFLEAHRKKDEKQKSLHLTSIAFFIGNVWDRFIGTKK
jgi:uncharacterized protein (TIGR02646 family)